MHMCGSCGYAGAACDFGDDVQATAELRHKVWSELAPTSRRMSIVGSDKYEAAVRVAEWQGADLRQVADLLLHAAWCSVDEGDLEAERYFRRKAARAFEAALSQWNEIAREDRALITYLIGELWRRVGDQAKATE